MLIHKGVRPKGELVRVRSKGIRVWKEMLPDGGYRLWNEQTLRNGCGNAIKVVREARGLIYCPHCEKWYNKEQFTDERFVEDTRSIGEKGN